MCQHHGGNVICPGNPCSDCLTDACQCLHCADEETYPGGLSQGSLGGWQVGVSRGVSAQPSCWVLMSGWLRLLPWTPSSP